MKAIKTVTSICLFTSALLLKSLTAEAAVDSVPAPPEHLQGRPALSTTPTLVQYDDGTPGLPGLSFYADKQPTTYGSQIISRLPIQFGMLVVRMKPSLQDGIVSAAYTFEYHPPQPAAGTPTTDPAYKNYYDWQWNEIDIEFVPNTLNYPRFWQACNHKNDPVKWTCTTAYDALVEKYKKGDYTLDMGDNPAFPKAGTPLSQSDAELWAARRMPTPYGNQWLTGIVEDLVGTPAGKAALLDLDWWPWVSWPGLVGMSRTEFRKAVSFDFWNVARKDPDEQVGWRGVNPNTGLYDGTGTVAANTIQNFFWPDDDSTDLYANFNTYTIVWTPSSLAYYVNAPDNGRDISKSNPVYQRKVDAKGKSPKDFTDTTLGLENMGCTTDRARGNILCNSLTKNIYDVNYDNTDNATAEYRVPWPHIMLNIWTDGPGTGPYACDATHTTNCGAGGWGGMVPKKFIAADATKIDPTTGKLPLESMNGDYLKYNEENMGVTGAYYEYVNFYPLKVESYDKPVESLSKADFVTAHASEVPGKPVQGAFETDFTKIQNMEQLVKSGWFVSNNDYGQSIDANVVFQGVPPATKDGKSGQFLKLCDTYLPDYMPKIQWGGQAVDWPVLAKGCSGRYIAPMKDGARQVYAVVNYYGLFNNNPNAVAGASLFIGDVKYDSQGFFLKNCSAGETTDCNQVAQVAGGIDGWNDAAQKVRYALPGSEQDAKSAADPAYGALGIYHNTSNIGRGIGVYVIPAGKITMAATNNGNTNGKYLMMCVGGQLVSNKPEEVNGGYPTEPERHVEGVINDVNLGPVGADRIYFIDAYYVNGDEIKDFTCPKDPASGKAPASFVDMNLPGATPVIQTRFGGLGVTITEPVQMNPEPSGK